MSGQPADPEAFELTFTDVRRAATMSLAFMGGDQAGGNHVLNEIALADRHPEALIAMMELLSGIIRTRFTEAEFIAVLAGLASAQAQREADEAGAVTCPPDDEQDRPPLCGWKLCARRPLSSAPVCPLHLKVARAMLRGEDWRRAVLPLLVAAGPRRGPSQLGSP